VEDNILLRQRGVQSGDKVETNWRQIGDKLVTNWRQIGDNRGDKTRIKV